MKRAMLATVLLLAGCKNTTDPFLHDEVCLASETQIVLVPQYVTTCANNGCTTRFSHFLPVPTTVCTKKTYIEYPNPDYIAPKETR